MLYQLLYPAIERFKYITFRASLSAIVAFFLCIILCPILIKLLKGYGLTDRAEKKDSKQLANIHKDKSNVPTMGGVVIFIALLVSTILFARISNPFVLMSIFVVTAFYLVGFLDDYIKLYSSSRSGLSIRLKLFYQALIGLIVGVELWLYFLGHLPNGTKIYLPIIHESVDIGVLYPIFVALVIVSSSNAVNLTDGLDGLAIGCITMAGMAYSVVSYIVGRVDYTKYLDIPYVAGVGELTIVSAALVGGSIGFLWFNCFPACIFMGNTGASAIGGLVGLIAVCTKQELLLFIVGAIFVVETLSVIIQIVSFRFLGRRVFKIAPLHHHFQFMNIAEPKITVRLWIVAAILALISVATLKL